MILIRRRPDGIVGVATEPHVKETWVFTTPMDPEAFHREMVAKGCHPIDSADVLAESKNSGFGYMPGTGPRLQKA
jgi:hypothetical protein